MDHLTGDNTGTSGRGTHPHLRLLQQLLQLDILPPVEQHSQTVTAQNATSIAIKNGRGKRGETAEETSPLGQLNHGAIDDSGQL